MLKHGCTFQGSDTRNNISTDFGGAIERDDRQIITGVVTTCSRDTPAQVFLASHASETGAPAFERVLLQNTRTHWDLLCLEFDSHPSVTVDGL